MIGRELLGRGVEIATFLFAMFGGFLVKAPPEEANAGFAVRLGSFMALVVLLIVSVWARGRFSARRRTVWTAVATGLAVVALISGLLYQRNWGRLTFSYPPDSPDAEYHVGGTRYTPAAEALAEQERLNAGQILARFNPENIDQVWTPETIADAKTILTVNYLVLVLSLAGTIFSLVEVYLAGEMSSEAGASKAPAQMDLTLALWQEKLGFLREQEAIASDPAQKYTLKKQIEEAEEKIRELTPVAPA